MSSKLIDKILEKQFKSALDFCQSNLDVGKDVSFWMAEAVSINALKRKWELEKEVDRDYKYSIVREIKCKKTT